MKQFIAELVATYGKRTISCDVITHLSAAAVEFYRFSYPKTSIYEFVRAPECDVMVTPGAGATCCSCHNNQSGMRTRIQLLTRGLERLLGGTTDFTGKFRTEIEEKK